MHPPKLLVNYVCCWVSWGITAVKLKIFLNFSNLDLLKKAITQPKLKKTKTSKKKETSHLDSKTVIEWTEQHQLILNEILDILKSPELMLFPDFEKLYMVYCDASETGLGAVLCQNQDGKFKSYKLWFKDTYISREKLPHSLWKT